MPFVGISLVTAQTQKVTGVVGFLKKMGNQLLEPLCW